MVTGNWHVLGAGAQGLLFYAYAQRHGHDWQLIARQCPATTTMVHYQNAQDHQDLPLRCTTLSQCSDLQQVIVAVKTTQLAAAIAELAPRLTTSADVILALNGVGWLESVRAQLPSQRLWLLSSIHGSYRPAPWQVVDSGNAGRLYVGAAEPTSAPNTALQALWQDIGFHCEWDEQIAQRLWRKAALNACINPLTALLNCRNGDLLDHPVAAPLLASLYPELTAVLDAVGAPVKIPQLRQTLAAACAMTASNYSSMQQDFRGGRETELDAIVGAFLREAIARHLPHQTLQQLFDAIAERQDWS